MAVSATNIGLNVRRSLKPPIVSCTSEAAHSSFLDSNEYVDIHDYEDISIQPVLPGGNIAHNTAQQQPIRSAATQTKRVYQSQCHTLQSPVLHESPMASKERSCIKQVQRETTSKNSTDSEDLCCRVQRNVRFHPSCKQEAEKSSFKKKLKSKFFRPKSALFQDFQLQASPIETKKDGWSSLANHSMTSAHKSQSLSAVKCSETCVKPNKDETKDHACVGTEPKLSWKRKDTQVVGVHLFQKMYHSLSTRRAKSLPMKQKQRPVITVIANKEGTCASDLKTVPHYKDKFLKQKLRESDLCSDTSHHAGFPSHGQKQAMSMTPYTKSKEALRKQYKHRPPPTIPPSTRNKERCLNVKQIYGSSSNIMHLPAPKFHEQQAQAPTKIVHSFLDESKKDTHRNYRHNPQPLKNSFGGEHAEKGKQPTRDHFLLRSFSCDNLTTESSNGQYMSLISASKKEVSSDYETLRFRKI